MALRQAGFREVKLQVSCPGQARSSDIPAQAGVSRWLCSAVCCVSAACLLEHSLESNDLVGTDGDDSSSRSLQ